MELLEFKASTSVNVQLRGYLHSGSNCVEKDSLHNANLPVKEKKNQINTRYIKTVTFNKYIHFIKTGDYIEKKTRMHVITQSREAKQSA